MKLTDQEQVILKAIGHVGRGGLAEVSKVIKAVSYPKATTKKILVRMSEKGIVSLHRHDWPQSLTPAQRKLMVLSKGHYYNAVSIRERNPKGKHLAGATAKEQRQYEAILKSIKTSGRYKGREKEVAARTAKARAKNKSGKGKQALKTTGRALKKAASSVLGAGSQILGAGAKALNPSKKKTAKRKKNKTIIKAKRVLIKRVCNPRKRKAQAGKIVKARAKASRAARKRNLDHRDSTHQVRVHQHWRAGGLSQWQRAHHAGQHDLFAHGIKARNPGPLLRYEIYQTIGRGKDVIGTVSARSPAEALKIAREKFAPLSIARSARKLKARKIGVIAHNASRANHPKSVSKKRARASSKTGRKKTTTKVRSVAKTRKASTRRVTRNPSPESIRKSFAGSVSGSRDLFFPQGTPQGLAKLGKLVSITTEEGTIKPVHGSAWLCADTKGKLHIGSVNSAPLFDGPKRSFGKVSKIEYLDVKKHLGHTKPTIFFHRIGEENGIKPTLTTDGKGGLIFKGGDYRITYRGLEN